MRDKDIRSLLRRCLSGDTEAASQIERALKRVPAETVYCAVLNHFREDGSVEDFEFHKHFFSREAAAAALLSLFNAHISQFEPNYNLPSGSPRYPLLTDVDEIDQYFSDSVYCTIKKSTIYHE